MDFDLAQWLILIAITFVATVAQTAIGFGFALMALPVFLLVLPVDGAIQLAMILSLEITILMIMVVFRDIPKTAVKWILVGSIAGFPVGLMLFYVATATMIKLAVAISILVAIYMTYRRAAEPYSQSRANALACGLVSGAMVTSIAMAGPAIAVYVNALGFSKSATRATIFAVFLFSYPVAIISQLTVYGFSPIALTGTLYLAPVVVIGTFFGQWLAVRISERFFRNMLSGVLVGVAIYLGCDAVIQGLSGS